MKRIILFLLCLFLLFGCSIFNNDNYDNTQIENTEQLHGKRIGVVTGTVFDPYIKETFPTSKIVYVNTRAELILALKSKKIDAFVLDDYIVNQFLKDNDDIIALDEDLLPIENAFVFSKDNLYYTNEFNEYINYCKLNGYLDYLKDKWVTNYTEDTKVPDIVFSGERGTINVITTTDSIPMSYIGNGDYQGYDIELLYSFCSYAGYTPNIQNANFDAIITAVSSNKYDIAIGGITISEERKKSVVFSDVIYNGNTKVVVLDHSKDEQNVVVDDQQPNNNSSSIEVKVDDSNSQIIDNNEVQINDNVNQIEENQIIDNNEVQVDDIANQIEENQTIDTNEVNIDNSISKEEDNSASIFDNINFSFNFFNSFIEKMNKMFIEEDRWLLILSGIKITVIITLASLFFGTLFGFALYLACRKASNRVCNIVDKCAFVINRIPVIIILMFMFYIVFANISIEGEYISIFGFSLIETFSIYTMLNIGISAIDKGQYEAALALGYTDNQSLFKYVLPQALKIIMPSYKSDIVALIKATSVVGYITVQDLTRISDIIRSRTYEAFLPLVISAVFYFLLAWALSYAVDKLQNKLLPNKKSKEEVLKKYE